MSKKILDHFKKVDSVMHEAAGKFRVTLPPPLPSDQYFERLCRAIVGQQLSTKAVATIWGRFEELADGEKIEPRIILAIEHERMRGAGLSNAKANYVRGIAEAFLEEDISFEKLGELENEAVVEELTKLKGVGRWTAEMFCMFTLGREDLFSVGDLGLRRAMERMYGLDDPSEADLIEIAERWSPHRTYACRVLWESLDNNPDV